MFMHMMYMKTYASCMILMPKGRLLLRGMAENGLKSAFLGILDDVPNSMDLIW